MFKNIKKDIFFYMWMNPVKMYSSVGKLVNMENFAIILISNVALTCEQNRIFIFNFQESINSYYYSII